MGPIAFNSGEVLVFSSPDDPPQPDNMVVGEALGQSSCQYTWVSSPAALLRRLRSGGPIEGVVITPGQSLEPAIALCRDIKLDVRSAFVPIVFVLINKLADRVVDVFEAGADDCIRLPASPREVVVRLSKAVRARRASNGLEDASDVIKSLASAIEGRDRYTCGHVERVAEYSVQIGRRLRVDPDSIGTLRRGGIVHDIGKVAVPDQILNKPGRLTDEEMGIVRRHPLVGYGILRSLHTFRDVVPIVRWHHERPNGTGYPDGLQGDQLPLLPRIVAVADCFDALATDRPYRPALPPDECRQTLLSSARRGDLDPRPVDVLLRILDEGSWLPEVAGPAGQVVALAESATTGAST